MDIDLNEPAVEEAEGLDPNAVVLEEAHGLDLNQPIMVDRDASGAGFAASPLDSPAPQARISPQFSPRE
jgi:hypothetical protein